MLAVAVQRVHDEGLQLDYSNIELEDLIRAAGVPRSTVFRIWPDRSSFVVDLVRALFEADPGFDTGFDGETLALLNGAAEASDLSRPAADRGIALRAVIRATAAHNVVAVEGTAAYRAYRTVAAAAAGGAGGRGDEQVRLLLAELVDRYVDRMSELYRALNDALGLRMRDGVTERDLSLAIMAVIEGMSDHRRIDPPAFDAPRRVDLGPEGVQDWDLAGLAVYGVYATLTQPAAG